MSALDKPGSLRVNMPRIVYLSWPASEVAGGIKLAHRHVEVLCDNGRTAVIATVDGKSPEWFVSRAKSITTAELEKDDVLVFPENHPGWLAEFAAWPNLKIVFCQNHFMAFRGLGKRRSYQDFGVKHIFAEGHSVAQYCRMRFPELPLSIVPVLVNEKVFPLRKQKRFQIAYMPRKRSLEAKFIRDLFPSVAANVDRMDWVEISGRTEREVSEILGSSALYLSLARFEACGMALLEAMSCGCLPVGFTGIGGREFTNAGNGFWAEEDDCIGCVRLLQQAVDVVQYQPDLYQQMIWKGQDTVRQYQCNAFAQRICEVWDRIVSSIGES